MDSDDKIRAALANIGAEDILSWAATRPTCSLSELNSLLGSDIAPVELEQYMAEEAARLGRYDRFVREQLVRLLHYYCPAGLAASKHESNFIRASAWSFWSSLFEPSHRGFAEQAYEKVMEVMRREPGWSPADADDPLLVEAFAGFSFTPTEIARRRKAVEKLTWQIVARDNTRCDEAKALENLRQSPKGYGFVYGLYCVDGEVCNGGFTQLYENTNGSPVPFAIEALMEIGRDKLAAVVAESMAYIKRKRPRLLLRTLRTAPTPGWNGRQPRELEMLDEEYYRLVADEDPDWLVMAIEDLLKRSPQIFEIA